MRYIVLVASLALLQQVACDDHNALAEEYLKHGRAPAPVFVPFDKGGAPAVADDLAMHAKAPEPVPLHIEQMVDFENQPLQESQDGFVVIG